MPKPRNAREAGIRNTYLSKLSRFLQEIYSHKLSDSILEEKRERLTGFIEAVLISGSLTSREIQALIDDEHHRAYGLTVETRGLVEKQLRDACASHNFDLFDSPAYERRTPRRVRSKNWRSDIDQKKGL